jgi:hypothetical protein
VSGNVGKNNFAEIDVMVWIEGFFYSQRF